MVTKSQFVFWEVHTQNVSSFIYGLSEYEQYFLPYCKCIWFLCWYQSIQNWKIIVAWVISHITFPNLWYTPRLKIKSVTWIAPFLQGHKDHVTESSKSKSIKIGQATLKIGSSVEHGCANEKDLSYSDATVVRPELQITHWSFARKLWLENKVLKSNL